MNIIETERLILRSWREEDTEIFAKMNQDPRVIEFLRGSMSLDEAKAFIIGANQYIATHGFGLWAATLKKELCPKVVYNRSGGNNL